jgi:hypothetical protein
MKGMVFVGCSFTWGQGLYFYHDMDKSHIPLKPNQYNLEKIKPSDLIYKDSIRFSRLVANHFDTFEITTPTNGSSDYYNIAFVNRLFQNRNTSIEEHPFNFSFDYDEIEYLIFQTTEPVRSIFQFEYQGKIYFYYLIQKLHKSLHEQEFQYWNEIYDEVFITRNDDNILFSWLSENKLTFDDLYEKIALQMFDKIISLFMELETHGIKPKILSRTNHYLELIRNNHYFNDKFISLNYENKKFDCIDDLFEYDKTLRITHDPDKKIEVVDDHPSKKCHQVIADSIISHIEEYENNISNG